MTGIAFMRACGWHSARLNGVHFFLKAEAGKGDQDRCGGVEGVLRGKEEKKGIRPVSSTQQTTEP